MEGEGAVGRRRVAQLLQASWRPEVLENRDEVPEREEEPVDDDGEELTPEELEALRSLAEVRLDDLVAQDTETAEAALTEAVEGASDEDAAADDELENRTYKRDRNGQFASTGAAQHSPRHSRASKGNPKNPTTQSNTPLKAAPGARPQEKVDAMARSIKRTAEHGGTVRDVAKVGDKMMTVPHGRAGRKNDRYAGGYGTAHQQSKHGKKEGVTPRKVAKAMVYGQKRKDTETGNVISERKRINAVYKPLKDKKAELITALKRKTPKS